MIFGASIQEGRKQLQFFGKDLKSVGGTIQQVFSGLTQWIKGNLSGNNQDRTFSSYFKQIYDMYPEMVRGFDAQGEAIMRVKGNVDELNAALDKEKLSAYNKLLDGSDSVLKKYHNSRTDGKTESKKYAKEFYDEVLQFYTETTTYSDLQKALDEQMNQWIGRGLGKEWTELYDQLIDLDFGEVFDIKSEKIYNDTARNSVIDSIKTATLEATSDMEESLQSVVNNVLLPSFWKYLINNPSSIINENADLEKFISLFLSSVDYGVVDELTSGEYASGSK